ncbi:MAG: hypothetical protein J6U40_12130, partial [Kiritimatiellae bacterium]|nr:hypothetical protein [Kiritimatiellia bacterium]
WLKARAAEGESTVTQPASYATADLETWLDTASNLPAALAFCYESRYAAHADFLPLTVVGTTFYFSGQDDGTTDSVTVSLVGSYVLTGDYRPDALSLLSKKEGGPDAYIAAEPTDRCFARLSIAKGWK